MYPKVYPNWILMLYVCVLKKHTMEVSLYLKRPKSKTETSIFARISYFGLRLKYYLPEKILPKYWNKDTQLARETKQFSESAEFNERIKNMVSEIKTIIRTYMNDNKKQLPSTDTLKKLLDTQIKFDEVIKPLTFHQYYQPPDCPAVTRRLTN